MPETTIDTLVDDIYALFDPNKTHVVDEENLDAFANHVKDVMRRGLAERDTGKEPLRFSNLGKPDRQIWYGAQGEPAEELSSKTYLKFMYGHLIEAMLLFLCKESGHEVDDEQLTVSCDGVVGHLDCTIDGVVVDVKSAAPFSYAKFVNGDYVYDVFTGQYLAQLCGYSDIVTEGLAPAFLVMDKVSGDIHLAKVSASIAEDYKPEPRIKHLKEVLASSEPPGRCYTDEPDGKSGNLKLPVGCSYCAHKWRCWDGLRAFAYAGGPKYLTRVVKTPEVPEFYERVRS